MFFTHKVVSKQELHPIFSSKKFKKTYFYVLLFLSIHSCAQLGAQNQTIVSLWRVQHQKQFANKRFHSFQLYVTVTTDNSFEKKVFWK